MDKRLETIKQVKEEVGKIIDNIRPFEKIVIIADASGSPENLIIQREQKIVMRTLILSTKVDTSKIRPIAYEG
jgi:hypothetical protein